MPNQPPLNPDALDKAALAMCHYVVANREMGHGIRPVYHQYQSAKAAVSAYLAAALPEVTSVEQWDALPIGTMVRVHFNGNSELIIRCPANSGAGIGGMSFIGGRWWTEVFTVWNADKLEIKYIPEVNDA